MSNKVKDIILVNSTPERRAEWVAKLNAVGIAAEVVGMTVEVGSTNMHDTIPTPYTPATIPPPAAVSPLALAALEAGVGPADVRAYLAGRASDARRALREARLMALAAETRAAAVVQAVRR